MVKYIQKSQWWQQFCPPSFWGKLSPVFLPWYRCVRPKGRRFHRVFTAPWRDVQQMNASSKVVPSSPASQLLSLWSSFFLAILAAAAVDVCYISRPKVGFLKDMFKAKIEGIEGRKVVWCSSFGFWTHACKCRKMSWPNVKSSKYTSWCRDINISYESVTSGFIFCRLKSPLLLSIKKILLGVRPFEGEQGSDDFCYNDHYRVLLPYLVYWRYIAYPVVGPGAGNGGWGSIHIPQRKWNPEGCTNWLSQLHLIDEVKSMH